MPPKKDSVSSSYERQKGRDKKKEIAEKKEHERLEQVAKDKQQEEDHTFTSQMGTQSTTVRLNFAAADYVNHARATDAVARISRIRDGMTVPEICKLYDVKQSAFYNAVAKLKNQRAALDTDAKIRAATATTSSSAAPLGGGGAAVPSRTVRFQDDTLNFGAALQLGEEAKEMAWKESLRQRKELQKKLDETAKAAADHKSSLLGKKVEKSNRKAYDKNQEELEKAAKKAKKDVKDFDSQLLNAELGADSLGAAAVGRPQEFTDETIDAVIAHFNKIQTTIKNGVSQAALVQMLLRYRQKMQSPSGGVLRPPSKSCLRDAVLRCDTHTCNATNAPDSRSRALEDWRNAICCLGMWFGLNKFGIRAGLKFNIDDVGTFLGSNSRYVTLTSKQFCKQILCRNKKCRIAHFRKGVVEEAIQRRLSPAIEETQHQPRMVYFSCMTDAAGELPATVVTIKDRQIPKNHVEMKQIQWGDRELFVCFAHPAYDKKLLSRLYLKRVFLPRIHRSQLRVLEQLKESGCDAGNLETDSQDLFNEFGRPAYIASASALPTASLPKAILTFDGANEQIEPIISSKLGEVCSRMNIALFKFAAACSLVQQPNDVSPCHKILHAYFRLNDVLREATVPDCLQACSRVMKKYKFAPTTQKTFNQFFVGLNDVLHEAFTPTAVRQGWTDSGLHDPVDGISVDRIMSGWNPGTKLEHANWNTIGDLARDQIRSVVPALADIGMRRGEISDPEIEGVKCANGQSLKELMVDVLKAGYPDWMKIQPDSGEGTNIGVQINRRRCILLSHPEWLKAAQLGRVVAGRGLDHSKYVACSLAQHSCSFTFTFQMPMRSEGHRHCGSQELHRCTRSQN